GPARAEGERVRGGGASALGGALTPSPPTPLPRSGGEGRKQQTSLDPALALENHQSTPPLRLVVEDAGGGTPAGCSAPFLEAAHTALVEADRLQQLPADYTDITEGLFAAWKRRVKRKLLGNFKHAYVDVLSRQQSAFNRHVLAALQELAECCATLDHAGQRP